MAAAPDARSLGPDDWILSYFSLRGATWEQRLDAASAAGFPAIGFLLHEYLNLAKEGRTAKEMRADLEGHGLALAEIEALLGWGGRDTSIADRHLATACEMAEAFGSRHLQVNGPFEGDISDAARAFARVCDQAAEAGLRVAIEYLPPNNIGNAAVALEIAERAGRENGGVCVDSWHHFRGTGDYAEISALPAARVVSLQLNDGALKAEDPDYFADTLANRRVCGEGEFDLARLLATLDATGARVPRSFEVISTGLQKLSFREAAARIAEGARRLPASPSA